MTFHDTARTLWQHFKEHPEVAINSLKEDYPDITPAEAQQLQQQLQKAMYCTDKSSMDKEFKKYAAMLKPIKARHKGKPKKKPDPLPELDFPEIEIPTLDIFS